MSQVRLSKDYGTIKKMNDNVYKQRRVVMKHVYEAKNLLRKHDIQLPRINVRIVDRNPECEVDYVGLASMGAKNIFIPKDAVNYNFLRRIVFHEIIHAVLNIGHSDRCPLMNPVIQLKPSKDEIDKVFVDYFLKS